MIKFRGIEKGTDDFVFGNVFEDYNNELIIRNWFINEIGSSIDAYYYIYKETLGQFTEATDIQGKEIYEGDIVRQKITDEVKASGFFYWFGVVEKYKGCWIVSQIGFDYKDTDICDRSLLFDDKCEYGFEIIGNIHQHKKLYETLKRVQ